MNPAAAGALVNLGTIYYRLLRFAEAEEYYKEAIAADPQYPLAQFNLGNLYDERGARPRPFSTTGAPWNSTPTMPMRTSTWPCCANAPANR